MSKLGVQAGSRIQKRVMPAPATVSTVVAAKNATVVWRPCTSIASDQRAVHAADNFTEKHQHASAASAIFAIIPETGATALASLRESAGAAAGA